VETDSVCLRVALDTYKVDDDMTQYIDIAWINYSYGKSSSVKKALCVEKIFEIISNEQQLALYPYLTSYVSAFEKAWISLSDKDSVEVALFQNISNWYKVLFKVK
jgi:hypothetical protein